MSEEHCGKKWYKKYKGRNLKNVHVWPMNIVVRNDIKELRLWNYEIGLNLQKNETVQTKYFYKNNRGRSLKNCTCDG